MNHDTARALSKIHDMQNRLESVGIEPAWVAVPITMAGHLDMDPSAPNCTLFGMRVMWVDSTDCYLSVRA